MVYRLAGFNGQRPDPVSGHSHLGNGYRAYTPVLGRFTAPDSMSPFGAGGINPYAYCIGDPVNRADPSGHFSLGQGLGTALGLVGGFVLGVLTEGMALPVVASLLANMAGDAAIGALSELTTEAVDGQQINGGKVGMAALVNAGFSLAGFGLGRLSKLKGTSNRPFGGLMMEGDITGDNFPLNRRTFLGISGDTTAYAYSHLLEGENVLSFYGHGTAGSKYFLNGREVNSVDLNRLLPKIPGFQNSSYVRLDFCHSAGMAQELSRLIPDKYIGGYSKEAMFYYRDDEIRQVTRDTVKVFNYSPGMAKDKWHSARDYFNSAVPDNADLAERPHAQNRALFMWYRNGEEMATVESFDQYGVYIEN
jgi:RHS repeat-associated protein